MEYWISNEHVILENLRYIGEGKEGKVYQYFKEAIKIYCRERLKNRLSLEEASYLSIIPTKYILLPKRMIKNDDQEFCGYTTIYKEDQFKENPPKFLWDFPIEYFF